MSKFRLPQAGTIEISPSILSADFANLGSEIGEVESAGVKMIHLDVMDGHFVPNITIGPVVISKLRKCSDAVFDTHLMISDPKKYAKSFADAGADHITFHIEANDDPVEMIDYLHSLGVSAGVSLNPETPVAAIERIATLCEMILVMTVHPGFGGQEYIDSAGQKCRRIREIVGSDVRIEVDGGINPETIGVSVSYGADTIVAGHSIFSEIDRSAAIAALVAGIKQ
jgi:ribulose-phosphate 3-epimerase